MFEDILLGFVSVLCLWLLFGQWCLREENQHLKNRMDLFEYEAASKQGQAETPPVTRGDT